jgi:hypothetical protein
MKPYYKNPNIFLLIFCLFLIECSSTKGSIKSSLRKRPDHTMKVDVNASKDFKDGWSDGCEVGMSAGSNTFYKGFYENNKVDGNRMTSSSDYEQAWSNAFWYCYRSDYVRQKSSIWGSYFGGYK